MISINEYKNYNVEAIGSDGRAFRSIQTEELARANFVASTLIADGFRHVSMSISFQTRA